MTTIKKSYTIKKQPKFTATSTIKGKSIITYKLDHDPKEDESWERHVGEIEEIEDPNPIDESHRGYEGEVDYNAKKKTSKVKYKCSGPDDDYIEVPGGTESVTWTDEDGQSYEVDISDLQEYDGDDGEIEYTSGKRGKKSLKLSHKLQDKVPPVIMAKQNIQLAMFQQFGPRVYC